MSFRHYYSFISNFRYCKFRAESSGKIYALPLSAEKTINKKKGKLFSSFVDLKAEFDKVSREKLQKYLRGKSIKADVMDDIERIYRETKSMVKIGKNYTEPFSTEKGVRQGCLLLFILFIADIEENPRKRQEGGITIANKRVHALEYTNGLAIIAETEEEMERMMKYLNKYFKDKELELNAEKSKIMVSSKGKSRKKGEWKWKDK